MDETSLDVEKLQKSIEGSNRYLFWSGFIYCGMLDYTLMQSRDRFVWIRSDVVFYAIAATFTILALGLHTVIFQNRMRDQAHKLAIIVAQRRRIRQLRVGKELERFRRGTK